jgi:hypothetical protein
MRHKLRDAMVAPSASCLSTKSRSTSSFFGGYEEGLRGGRQRGKKTLYGVAIEVRRRGSGRLRLTVLPDASRPALLAFTQATTQAGAIVHTDGLQAYRVLGKHGYDHRRRPKTTTATGKQLLPRRTARSPTSRHGCTAPTAASHPSTSQSISTSYNRRAKRSTGRLRLVDERFVADVAGLGDEDRAQARREPIELGAALRGGTAATSPPPRALGRRPGGSGA